MKMQDHYLSWAEGPRLPRRSAALVLYIVVLVLAGACSQDSSYLGPTTAADPSILAEPAAPALNCSNGVCDPLTTDVLVVGASSGGTAAAIAAARRGVSVILTEETGVAGGQFTAQGLTALDEGLLGSQLVEARTYIGLYDDLKRYAREYYRSRSVLNRSNPGNCFVSELCFEPRVAGPFFAERLAELSSLQFLAEFRPIGVIKVGNSVIGAELQHRTAGDVVQIYASVTIDGTELGDVIHLSGAPYRLGPDLRSDTGEVLGLTEFERDGLRVTPIRQVVPYAPPDQQLVLSGVMVQPFTVQFAMSRGIDGGIAAPVPDDLSNLLAPDDVSTFLRNTFPDLARLHDPGAERNVMSYRRVLHGSDSSGNDVSLSVINYLNEYRWALAYDYIGDPSSATIPYERREAVFGQARDFSRWYVSYLQDRFEGYVLYPHAFTGSDDGFAVHPYIREGRRLRALDLIRADDIALWCRYVSHGDVELPCRYGMQPCDPTAGSSGDRDACAATNGQFGVEFLYTKHTPRVWDDTIAISSYDIDVHRIMPSGPFAAWKDNYLGGVSEPWRSLKESALTGLPFGVPYGASIPESIDGLLATAKNMGSTHVSNGAVRLQPSEMNHGESIGLAAALSVELGVRPRDLHDQRPLLNRLIGEIVMSGRSLAWFDDLGMYGTEEYFEEIQYGAARGYFSGFRTEDSRLPHFRPYRLVKRQEIAKVVVEWMDWPIEIGAGAPHFDDVPPSNPFYGYVETLLSNGVTLGCGDGAFCPNSPVTRESATVHLVEATRADLVNPSTPSFRDVLRSHWAYTYMETANALGWYRELWPTDEGFAHPGAYLTRRELAKLLFNIDLADTPISPGQL
jgi:hypothetical protein